MYIRKLILINQKIEQIISQNNMISEMALNINKGDVYVIKRVFDEDWIENLKTYLVNVGKNSLPNYESIEIGAPNFHRINRNDSRAYVKGSFHQFVFYPWNQDYFNIFDKCKYIFFMKNLISGLKQNKFLNNIPEDNCTARIAVQYYPQGEGFLNKHSDPVDHHQLVVPMLIMSKRGEDFMDGGAFFENKNSNIINIEDRLSKGDLIIFNADLNHGVQKIDPNKNSNWINFNGRWTMLFAVNKLANNDQISNSIDQSV
jgi:hypothetical protein